MQSIETIKSTLDHLREEKGLGYLVMLADPHSGDVQVRNSSELERVAETVSSQFESEPLVMEPNLFADNILPEPQVRYQLDLASGPDVTQFLAECFRKLQQVQCKTIAKSWIRIVEPKKQARHKYKLGDVSKPLWWPEDVRHKEPDHLLKGERIFLMVSICQVFNDKLGELRAAAKKAVRMEKYKWDILDEALRVADAEYKFRMNRLGMQRIDVLYLESFRDRKPRSKEKKDEAPTTPDSSFDSTCRTSFDIYDYIRSTTPASESPLNRVALAALGTNTLSPLAKRDKRDNPFYTLK